VPAFSESHFGHGLEGRTQNEGAAGVFGQNDRGEAILGASDTGTGVHGLTGNGTGVRGSAQIGEGVIGESENGPGVVGRGAHEGPGVYGESPATGVLGQSENGDGLSGHSRNGTAVHAQSIFGTGVEARSSDGLALDVHGKARFSTAGTGTIAAGTSSKAVTVTGAVSASSAVLVTLLGDPGPRQLEYVQRAPPNGFIVRMSGNVLRPVSFAYLVINQGVGSSVASSARAVPSSECHLLLGDLRLSRYAEITLAA
jgi:hypothetical protein